MIMKHGVLKKLLFIIFMLNALCAQSQERDSLHKAAPKKYNIQLSLCILHVGSNNAGALAWHEVCLKSKGHTKSAVKTKTLHVCQPSTSVATSVEISAATPERACALETPSHTESFREVIEVLDNYTPNVQKKKAVKASTKYTGKKAFSF